MEGVLLLGLIAAKKIVWTNCNTRVMGNIIASYFEGK